MSYQNNKHVIRLTRYIQYIRIYVYIQIYTLYIQILAFSRLLSHNQTPWESLTKEKSIKVRERSIDAFNVASTPRKLANDAVRFFGAKERTISMRDRIAVTWKWLDVARIFSSRFSIVRYSDSRRILGQLRTRPMQPPDFAHFFVQKTKNAKNAVYTFCHKTACSVFPAWLFPRAWFTAGLERRRHKG